MAWLVEIAVCSGGVDTEVPDLENLLTTICVHDDSISLEFRRCR